MDRIVRDVDAIEAARELKVEELRRRYKIQPRGLFGVVQSSRTSCTVSDEASGCLSKTVEKWQKSPFDATFNMTEIDEVMG